MSGGPSRAGEEEALKEEVQRHGVGVGDAQ